MFRNLTSTPGSVMRTAYFDLLCGASGDMILASLISAGVPLDLLNKQLAKLSLSGVVVSCSTKSVNGIAATNVEVPAPEQHTSRHLPQILRIIDNAGLSERIASHSKAVFERLGHAEAKVHGIDITKVHFHEVGALDSLVDIVGACIGFEYLDIEEILFGDLTVGSGTVTCQHGVLPVPAPATAALIAGHRIAQREVNTEILTPTGAAILTTLGKQSRAMPQGHLLGWGYGAGSRDIKAVPNVLRVALIDVDSGAVAQDNNVVLLESDMDHICGETMGYVAQKLLDNGALDVSWSPLFMKKGRPGYRLSVICATGNTEYFINEIMIETRTLGVRELPVRRHTAWRRLQHGEFDGQKITEKYCRIGEYAFTKIEYEDLAELARSQKRPFQEIAEDYIRKQNHLP
ncbi:MAG: nickel pincer cofactor biosynthesis protein LarC [Chitinivibrionales bacterium]|nr:nickel pincer cofactor biosynthesis protein LarC [Chitinivibrionales bacterium]